MTWSWKPLLLLPLVAVWVSTEVLGQQGRTRQAEEKLEAEMLRDLEIVKELEMLQMLEMLKELEALTEIGPPLERRKDRRELEERGR